MSALASLGLALLNLLTGFVENRQKIGEAKAVAKIDLQKAAVTSWTGRLIVLFWFYPAVACYVGPLRESAGQGFALLSAQPEWYLALLVTISCTLLGIEKIRNLRR